MLAYEDGPQAMDWLAGGVSAHIERARATGATIPPELEADDEGKRYRAEDPEAHRWMFMER